MASFLRSLRSGAVVAALALACLSIPVGAQTLPALPAMTAGGGSSGGLIAAPRAAAPTVGRKFQFTPYGTVTMSYTDNVLLTRTNRKPDVVTSPSAGFELAERTARIDASVSGKASYDYYSATTRLNSFSGTGRARVKVDLFEPYLSIEAHGATDRQRASQLGSSPAGDRAFGSNQTQVLNYGAVPTLRARFGNFAQAEATYDIAFVNHLDHPLTGVQHPSNTIQQTVSTQVKSGSYFDIVTWSAQGSLERSDKPGPNSASRRRNADGSLYWALFPSFQVVGTGGYDDVREPTLRSNLGGVHATGGIRWSLSPRTKVTFDGGWRYDRPYYNADVSYGLARTVALHARYGMTIETPQRLLAANLNRLITTPSGQFLDPITGLPADPNGDPFGITDQAFRRRVIELGLQGKIGRSGYSLSGSVERREGTQTARSKHGTAEVYRQLTQHLRASLSAGYEKTEGSTTGLGGNSETVSGRAQFDYSLGEKTTLNAAYIFRRTHSSLTHTRESAVALTLSRNF